MSRSFLRLILILILFLNGGVETRAANVQLKDLTATTTAASTDIVGLQIDVTGTFRDRKMTLANFATTIGTTLSLLQPYDSDLTSIAALSTATFGRSLLTQSTAAAALSTLTAMPAATIVVRTGAGAATAYSTLALAHAAAVAASPSSSNPIVIELGAGVSTLSANLTMSTGYITIAGSGSGSTILSLTGSAVFTVATEHITVSNLALVRSGSNAAAVLTVSMSSAATWKDDIHFDNVYVENLLGTAIGTTNAQHRNVRVLGMTAVDWNYGGQWYGSTITGHDPALDGVGFDPLTGAVTYAVKNSQSCMTYDYNAFPDLQYKDRRTASFQGCLLTNSDPNGIVINGLNSIETGDRTTTDWSLDVTDAPRVEAFGTVLNGCRIYGPKMIDGTGTGCGLRGTFWCQGNLYYGDRMWSDVHDSEFNGGELLGSYALTVETFNTVTSSQFGGVNIVINPLYPAMVAVGDCLFSNCPVQNDSVNSLLGNQYMFFNSTDTTQFEDSTDAEHIGPFGFQSKMPICLRLGRTASTCAFTATATSEFLGPTMTYEFWFRMANTAAQCTLLGLDDATATGGGVFIRMQPNVGTNGTLNAYVRGTDAAALANSGLADQAWHHVAVTVNGTAARTMVDGVSVGTATVTALAGTTRLMIGNDFAFGSTTAADCDIGAIRISNIIRYDGATFTPKKDWLPDASCVALYSMKTNRALRWTDQMGERDAALTGGSSNGNNFPFWVRRDHAFGPRL
jgi:hypothetical protein